MSDLSRLKILRNTLGMTQLDVAKILEIGQTAYSMIETGKVRLTDRNLRSLSRALKVNPLWLEAGIGDMFLDPVLNIDSRPTSQSTHQGVPLYTKPFKSPTILSLDDIAREEFDYHIDYQPLNDCTLYRPVYGDSMSPRYNPGDIVACKKIANHELILYGETYLCIVRKANDTYETIKTIRRHSDNPSLLVLKPINPNYDDTIIDADTLTDLYIIRGKIERNT